MEYAFKPENLRQLEEETRKAGFPEEMVGKLRDHVLNDKSYAFYIIAAIKAMERSLFASLYYERSALVTPYEFKHFNLSITGASRPPIHENQFVRGNGYDVTLREAVGLMEGRMIYRQPEFDRDRSAYWVRLSGPSQWPGRYMLDYLKSDFRVEEAIARSGLDRWLDGTRIKELALQLNGGERVQLKIAPMGQARTVWAEADPLNRRLVLTNNKRQHVGLPGIEPAQKIELPAMRRSKGIRH